MSKTLVKPRTQVRTKTERPRLYKVILLNDDFTPREFVVSVLKAVFRMGAARQGMRNKIYSSGSVVKNNG